MLLSISHVAIVLLTFLMVWTLKYRMPKALTGCNTYFILSLQCNFTQRLLNVHTFNWVSNKLKFTQGLHIKFSNVYTMYTVMHSVGYNTAGQCRAYIALQIRPFRLKGLIFNPFHSKEEKQRASSMYCTMCVTAGLVKHEHWSENFHSKATSHVRLPAHGLQVDVVQLAACAWASELVILSIQRDPFLWFLSAARIVLKTCRISS
jgi:hypothetical protein